MKVYPMDLGVCGVVQLFQIAHLKHDTDIPDGGYIELGELPADLIILGVAGNVLKEFNAGTTNTITVGTDKMDDDIFAADDVDLTKAGGVQADKWMEINTPEMLRAKLTLAGAKATSGEVELYLKAVRRPPR